jgi:hypothetical protein
MFHAKFSGLISVLQYLRFHVEASMETMLYLKKIHNQVTIRLDNRKTPDRHPRPTLTHYLSVRLPLIDGLRPPEV